jgi:hypothetical protein
MSNASTDRSLIERLARHLATQGAGDWSDCVEEAANILAILKEPDAAMAQAGDAAIWHAMIDAALTERWTIGGALSSASATPPPAGSDEEGEIAIEPGQSHGGARSRASWVHVRDTKGE